MVGNRLGWLISAAMVVVVVVGLTTLGIVVGRSRERQTEKKQERQQNAQFDTMTIIGQRARAWKLQPAIPPRAIAQAWMTESGDPAPLYRQAIKEYNAAPRFFENYKATATDDLPFTQREQIDRVMNLLIKASRLSGRGVIPDEADKLISYDPDISSLKALRTMGEVAAGYAWFWKNKKNDPAKAWELYQARFSLGTHLFEERITAKELVLAHQMLAIGRTMQADARSEEQKQKLDEFNRKWAEFWELDVMRIYPGALYRNDLNVYDMVALATQGTEMLWRVEATLALGRCRHSCQDYKTQQIYDNARHDADKTIQALINSGDPYIKLAAQAASKLTVEEWRKMAGAVYGIGNPFDL